MGQLRAPVASGYPVGWKAFGRSSLFAPFGQLGRAGWLEPMSTPGASSERDQHVAGPTPAWRSTLVIAAAARNDQGVADRVGRAVGSPVNTRLRARPVRRACAAAPGHGVDQVVLVPVALGEGEDGLAHAVRAQSDDREPPGV